MKTISLGRGVYSAVVDDADYDLLSRVKWSPQINYRRDGSVLSVYAARSERRDDGKKRKIYMHRVIAGVDDPSVEVDHHNHDGLDNRRENLRICTLKQNRRNSRGRYNSTYGVKGVDWMKSRQKFRARISVDGVYRHLGYFDNINDAASAYAEAAKDAYGEYVCLEGGRDAA